MRSTVLAFSSFVGGGVPQGAKPCWSEWVRRSLGRWRKRERAATCNLQFNERGRRQDGRGRREERLCSMDDGRESRETFIFLLVAIIRVLDASGLPTSSNRRLHEEEEDLFSDKGKGICLHQAERDEEGRMGRKKTFEYRNDCEMHEKVSLVAFTFSFRNGLSLSLSSPHLGQLYVVRNPADYEAFCVSASASLCVCVCPSRPLMRRLRQKGALSPGLSGNDHQL